MPEDEDPLRDVTVTSPLIGRGDIIHLDPYRFAPGYRRWEVAFLVVNRLGVTMVALANERMEATAIALDDYGPLVASGRIVRHDRFSPQNSLPYPVAVPQDFTEQYEIGTLIRWN
jgi:hypothetical protein